MLPDRARVRIGEAARLLGVSQRRVRTLGEHGFLEVTKEGRGHRFITLASINAYLAWHGRTEATAEETNREHP